MNTLHKISYGLFAIAFVAALLTHMISTFLFFTAGVIVLAMGVYVKDKQDEGRE